MKKIYFAASNSCMGFKNYYEDCFSKLDKLYIIKGGPGTGKSGFMRSAARVSEEKGYDVEYFYCSSDPSSLDGVIIDKNGKKLGIIDGTAPHAYEPRETGYKDNIINLGQCWQDGLLEMKKDEIIKLNYAKSACYTYAYDYLRSCGNLRAVSDALCRENIDYDKMSAAACRLVRGLPAGDKTETKIRLIDSVSMLGRVRFDTYEFNASHLYIVGDMYGAGNFMMEELAGEISRRKIEFLISYDPVCPDKINALYEPVSGSAFVLTDKRMNTYEKNDSEKTVKYINIKRFVKGAEFAENKSELKYAGDIYKTSLHGAIAMLYRAKKYHFLIEEIYKGAMNFSLVDEMICDFCNSVL